MKFTVTAGTMHRAIAVLVLLCIVLLIWLTVGCSSETTEAASTVSEADLVKRGEYLVNVSGCHDCHTPKKMGPQGPEPNMTRMLSGHPASEAPLPVPAGALGETGWIAMCNPHLTAWAGPWGISFAINLTPHEVTGIGAWTPDVFIKAMRTGKHLGSGRPILPPMPWQGIGMMTDDDLRAIFTYLKSIKPIENQVPLPVPPEA